MNTLKEWIEHYDFINEARWGDDDKEPPTWEEVRDEHLSDWNDPEDMSWEYWNAYVTSMIIHYAREEVRKLAVLAERERCAKVADGLYEKWRKLDSHAALSARVIRDAIRKDPTCQE